MEYFPSAVKLLCQFRKHEWFRDPEWQLLTVNLGPNDLRLWLVEGAGLAAERQKPLVMSRDKVFISS